MGPKKTREDEESPSGMHRRLEDGTVVEITSPRRDQSTHAPIVDHSGIRLPWQWLSGGVLALVGVGGFGSNFIDADHSQLVTKHEMAQANVVFATKADLAKLQADVTDLHDDVDDVRKILDQIVTTKIILKESP